MTSSDARAEATGLAGVLVPALIAMETGENKDKISHWLKKSEELRAREEKKDYNLEPFRYQ